MSATCVILYGYVMENVYMSKVKKIKDFIEGNVYIVKQKRGSVLGKFKFTLVYGLPHDTDLFFDSIEGNTGHTTSKEEWDNYTYITV